MIALRQWFVMWLWLGLCLAPVSVGSAQEGDGDYAALIRRALIEYEAGRWEEAGALFGRAHALEPNARTLRGLGLVAFEMRDYVNCLTNLRAALAQPRRPLTPELRRQVEQLIEQAEQFVARRRLELSPADARVRVDAEPATIDAGLLLLNPGEHELVVEAPEHRTLRRRIQVRSGSTGTLELRLESDRGGATVAPAEATARTDVTQESREGGAGPWPWVLTIGGGALLAGAGASWAVSLDAAADLDEMCGAEGSCPPAAASTKSRGEATQTAARILGVTGALALGIGITLLLLEPSEPTEPAAALACGPSGCSLSTRVAF